MQSRNHPVCGVAILIGLIAIAVANPWIGIPIGIGLYALWRTC